MSNEPNTQANSAFDALPLATRSAIGAHVTKQLRAAGTSQKNFVSTFVAQCERIAENPDAVATILAESKSAGIVM
jgi:hypothetical protein